MAIVADMDTAERITAARMSAATATHITAALDLMAARTWAADSPAVGSTVEAVEASTEVAATGKC
jgi:hypothetical protein